MIGERLSVAVLCMAPIWAVIGPAHADARSANSGGLATLSGQAFLTSMGGEAVTCAGREVTILSDDPPARSAGSEAVAAAAYSGSVRSVLHTVCDNQGHFAFAGLAARDWTIRASIRWDVRAKQGIRHLGGDVVQHVALRAGDNNVVLNDRDLYPRSPETSRMAEIVP